MHAEPLAPTADGRYVPNDNLSRKQDLFVSVGNLYGDRAPKAGSRSHGWETGLGHVCMDLYRCVCIVGHNTAQNTYGTNVH